MHNMLQAPKLKASQGPLHYNHIKQCSNDLNHAKQSKNILDSQHRWQEKMCSFDGSQTRHKGTTLTHNERVINMRV